MTCGRHDTILRLCRCRRFRRAMNALDNTTFNDHLDCPELNERGMTILRLMAGRLFDKEIAPRLDLSVNTAKWYAGNIYEKLGGCSQRHQCGEPGKTSTAFVDDNSSHLQAALGPLTYLSPGANFSLWCCSACFRGHWA